MKYCGCISEDGLLCEGIVWCSSYLVQEGFTKMKKWFLAAMMVIGMWAAAPGISVSAEESVEFVYVEKETVALSEEQNVVIGIGESVKTVCGAELYYHREEDG